MEVEFLKQKLSNRKEAGTLRSLKNYSNGIDFYSNDYLGLSKVNFESENTTMGSTGSRLLSGNHEVFKQTENYLAQFFKRESALLFNSGYVANLALLSAVAGKGDTILYDEKSHASIKDGLRLTFAKAYSFKHNSPSSLSKKLKIATGKKFVVIESIYSMDGTEADLENIVSVCNNYGAYLIVDEAHSTGIYGEYGEGYILEKNMKDHVFASIHTFGKAIGRHGACVCGSEILKEYLVNFSRPFIYTTALPPHSIEDLGKVLRFVETHNETKTKLFKNIEAFKTAVKQFGLEKEFIASNSPIQGYRCFNREKTRKLAQFLNQSGFCLQPIYAPTVPELEERIRITIHAYNTEKEINSLIESIHKYNHQP